MLYVKNEDGSFSEAPADAVPAVQDAPTPTPPEDTEPEVYVHLADGSVLRMPESEAPAASGTNAPQGHVTRDGKTFLVIGVYPVETEVK
jgi:hypothetical protein